MIHVVSSPTLNVSLGRGSACSRTPLFYGFHSSIYRCETVASIGMRATPEASVIAALRAPDSFSAALVAAAARYGLIGSL